MSDIPPTVSRIRSLLANTRADRPAEALAELRDSAQIVPQLPVQDLHAVIRAQGAHESIALLGLASPAQLRALIDIEIWQRDTLDLARLDDWLAIVLELRPARAARALRALDPELLELFLQDRLRIYDVAAGEEPEDTINPVWSTPDGGYLCEILAAEDQARRMITLLELLCSVDLQWMLALLLESRETTRSELQETAHQMRAARMSDLGFPPVEEAVQVYQPIPRRRVRLGEGTAERFTEPAVPEEAVAGSWTAPIVPAVTQHTQTFFDQALQSITDAGERERVGLALVMLCNRVLVADGLNPADPVSLRDTLVSVRDTLSLGLEVVCRGDLANAPKAFATIALSRIFGVALGVLADLQKLASTLARTIDVSALDSPWRETVLALRHKPPLQSGLLDDPPLAVERPFRSRADVQQTTWALEEAGAAVSVAAKLRISLDEARQLVEGCARPAAEITLGDLVRTIVARTALGHEPVAAPLTVDEVEQLVAQGLDADAARAVVSRHVSGDVATRLTRRWVDPLLEEISALKSPIDPRTVTGLVVRLRPPARG